MQVFLSHAHSDDSFANALSAELTSRGLSVWSGDKEVLPGDNLYQRIASALANSKAMVVLISPESMSSPYVRSEIEYALGNPNYEGRLFPVQVRPTNEVPWILRSFKTFTASQGARRISESIANALSKVA